MMNETMQTILHRRAIRRFDERQIDEELLQQILQAGLYAPSAGGKQGVIFAVCQDKEVNERLGKIKRANSNPHMATATNYVSREQPSIADDPKLTNAFYDAPTVITMFAPKNFLFSVNDCAVAAENMMLAADSLGIGSCYIGQGWTATDRKFCVNGKSAQIIMLSCSFYWAIRNRTASTPRQSREKMTVY